MSEKLMYLAGGITGLSIEQAFAWREYVASKCPEWLKVLSPLRAKTYIRQDSKDTGIVENCYPKKILSTAKGITCRDRNDVLRCDVMLVNFLKAPVVSIGTVMEISWADLARIPTVVVMEKDNVHNHCMIVESVGFITDNLDEAIEVCKTIVGTGI